MTQPWHLRQAARLVHSGGVIAYPTEAVFGLGCDPLNGAAVQRLFRIKGRAAAKGLILIAAEPGQIDPYILGLPREREAEILGSWPGPVTWILPARTGTPGWRRCPVPRLRHGPGLHQRQSQRPEAGPHRVAAPAKAERNGGLHSPGGLRTPEKTLGHKRWPQRDGVAGMTEG